MAISYDDYKKAWTTGGTPMLYQEGEGGGGMTGGTFGQRAEREGWGKADPIAEIQRRIPQLEGMTPAQVESWARTNGLPDPKNASLLEDMMPVLQMAAMSAGMYGLGNLAFGAGGLGAGAGAGTGGMQFPSQVMANGGLMPAAIPESVGTLQGWGLTEIAPGVWSAGGAGASLGGASAGATGGSAGAGASGGASGSAATGVIGKALSNPSILGAGAGALLGAVGGGSSPAGNVTTTEEMPDWLKGYMKPALDKYGTQLQNYQIDPYGVMSGAGKQFADTVNGMYLTPDSNKYLTDYFNAGAERVKGTLSPSFGHMQAFGGHSGYNEALAGGLTDLATGIYGGAYENERNRQAQMTAAAPSFLTQQSQAAFAPYQSYLQTLSGLGKQKTQPYFDNPFGNILGGAMAGYGLGNIFK